MKYGKAVSFTHKLKRIAISRQMETASGRKYRAVWKVWSEVSCNGTGLFLGTRTLKNGIREWEHDVGNIFIPKESFQAALISPGPHRNPIYVPISAILQEEQCLPVARS